MHMLYVPKKPPPQVRWWIWAGYVLGTFPIVRRQDQAQFGRYRTRDLILAYMNALSAGDAETVVAV